MVGKEQVLQELRKVLNSVNEEKITYLINKVESMSEEELATALKERKVKTIRDVKKYIAKKTKLPKAATHKFVPLNELVCFGVTGKTIHIHVLPKDARELLTREGMKKAELSLIDATEKIKVLMQTDKKYSKKQNVYAVSWIVSGPVARWFRQIGYDVKVLPIQEAKHDKELGVFYSRFKDKRLLGRANLSKEKLMSEEWEQIKNARKEELETVKKGDFVDKLQKFNSTDKEMVRHERCVEDEGHRGKQEKIIEEI